MSRPDVTKFDLRTKAERWQVRPEPECLAESDDER